ncbi:MAG TPA: hypothetical protein VKQ11_12555 [Candidatus Sulfotelmatobacter sp.]|nr:hypothetical protein [Candidatus Sulfotelmatobacter sp.]
MADTAQIVKSGTWRYDERIVHEVWIVKQNFDFYYDEGFEDAPEDLNENVEVFQVVFAKDGKVRSVGLAFHSVEEAPTELRRLVFDSKSARRKRKALRTIVA